MSTGTGARAAGAEERPSLPRYRVFISSTSQDLAAYRKEVRETLLRLNLFPIDMAYFGAQDGDASEVSLKEVDSADLYLGIVAWRYGYVPEGAARSVTHQEYDQASALDLPCLLFLADEAQTQATDGPTVYFPAETRDPHYLDKLLAFRLDIKTKHVVDFFTSPQDLAWRVSTAVSRWLSEKQQEEAQKRPAAPDLLPGRLQGFVGRAEEVQRLADLLRAGKHVALIGMGGLGKSSLAGEVAHTLRDEPGLFPGGSLWVKCQDRRKASGLADVYSQMMAAWRLALTEEELKRATTPEAEASVREQALRLRLSAQGNQRRRALIVLDNVEHDFSLKQALETLGALDMTVLLTSRKEPAAPNVSLVRLGVLDPQAAQALFAETYRNREGSWEPGRDAAHAAAVVAALGYLPLAIELAAARAALGMSVEALAAEFQQPGIIDRLSEADEDEDDAHASIRLTFEQSLTLLTPSQRARFVALGLPTGSDWPRPVIERLLGAISQDTPGVKTPQEDLRRLSALSLIGLVSPEAPAPIKRPSLAFLALLLRSDSPDASMIDQPAPSPAVPRVQVHPLLLALAREQFAQQPAATQRATLEALLIAVSEWIEEHSSDFSRLAQEENLILNTMRDAAREHIAPERLSAAIDPLFEYFSTGGHWLRGMEFLTLQRNARQDRGDRSGEGRTLNNLGQLAMNLGRIEQASYILNQALTIQREVGNRMGEGMVLHNLGLLAYLQGQMKEAKARFNEALFIARAVHDQRGEGTALASLGLLAQTKGNNDKAEQLYQQALPLLREARDRRVEGIVLSNLGVLAQGKGKLEEAAGYYQQALRIHRKIGNRPSEGSTLGNLAVLAQQIGHKEEAVHYAEQALAIADDFGDQRVKAGTLAILGALTLDLGREAEAEAYYQKALEAQRAIHGRVDEGSTLTYLGALYQRQGRADEARQALEQALVIHRETGNRTFGMLAANGLGQLAQAQGQREEAVRYYQEALASSSRYGDTKEEGILLNTLGLLLRDMGQHEQAGQYFQQALVIHHNQGNRREEGVTLNNMGLAALNLRQHEQAKQHFHEALVIHREVGNPSEEMTTLRNLEYLARMQNQFQEALDFGTQALAICRDLGNRQLEGVLLNNLGLAAANLKQGQQARESYQAALAIYREVGNRKEEATTLRNLLILAKAEGNPREALSYGAQILPIHRDLGDQEKLLAALSAVAELTFALGQLEETLGYYQEYLALCRNLGKRLEEATTLTALGLLKTKLGHAEEAVHLYQEALPIMREVGNRGGELATLFSLSFSIQTLGRLEEALALFEQAVALRQELDNPQEQQQALISLGLLAKQLTAAYQGRLNGQLERKDYPGAVQTVLTIGQMAASLKQYEQARGSFERALALAKEGGWREGEGHALTRLGDLAREQEALRDAASTYQQALAIFQQINAADLVQRLQEKLTTLDITLPAPPKPTTPPA
jgi:tetratricopeptide (TPR) repeat protein